MKLSVARAAGTLAGYDRRWTPCGPLSWEGIEMAEAETPVQMARRHCEEQEGRIERQKALIARLNTAPAIAQAEDLLLRMEDLLAVFQDDLRLLLAKRPSN